MSQPDRGGMQQATHPKPTSSRAGIVAITIVSAPACHFCADADAIVTQLARDYPQVTVRRLDLRSPEGQDLAQQHRAAMSPLVLLDGRFFSQGRLPRGKIRQLRGRLAAETTGGRR